MVCGSFNIIYHFGSETEFSETLASLLCNGKSNTGSTGAGKQTRLKLGAALLFRCRNDQETRAALFLTAVSSMLTRSGVLGLCLRLSPFATLVAADAQHARDHSI